MMIYPSQNSAAMVLRWTFLAIALPCSLFFQPHQTLAQNGNSTTPAASQMLAKQELNQAALSYRQGNFAEAQAHAEKALAWDPDSRIAPYFIARTIHAQYKPGDASSENKEKARAAIDAYQKILIFAPVDEEAYKAIAYLYGAIREDELLRDWILKRATDTAAAPEKRAGAYIVLASKDWDCSFKITELPTTKRVTVLNKQITTRYVMPKNQADFRQAHQCAEEGLEFTDLAIALTPGNESAWSYKANILLELEKLAEMAGETQKSIQFHDEYELAFQETKNLSEKSSTGQQNDSPVRVKPQPWQ